MASGGFTITLGSECAMMPEFVLGLLNAKLLFWCLRQASNSFRGGWITCTKQYFGELPIVSLDFSSPADRARHDKMVALVDKMLVLVPKLRAAKSEQERKTLQNAVDATDRQIDALVYELYGLTPEEIALVERESK
jgi:Xaa-Pro aminopeptidase